jgi:hypothetical protein
MRDAAHENLAILHLMRLVPGCCVLTRACRSGADDEQRLGEAAAEREAALDHAYVQAERRRAEAASECMSVSAALASAQRQVREAATRREELEERILGLEGERDLLAEGLVQVRVFHMPHRTPHFSAMLHFPQATEPPVLHAEYQHNGTNHVAEECGAAWTIGSFISDRRARGQ